VVVQVAVPAMEAVAEVGVAAAVEVLHSPVGVVDHNQVMDQNLEKWHKAAPAVMVIREDHGILQCQEQIQQEHLVQAVAVLAAKVVLDQILQGVLVEDIK